MQSNHQPTTSNSPIQEPLLTASKAAAALNIPYRQLLVELNAGSIPYYRIGNSRRMVFVSQVLASLCSNSTNQKEQDHA